MNQLRSLCVIACWIISITSADQQVEEKCEYTDCIFQNVFPRASPVDEFLPSLNITGLPDPAKTNCDVFRERAASCNDKRANCPSTVQEPYENRLRDYIYVDFLMQTGSFACEYQHEFDKLKHCFTDNIESHVHECFKGIAFDKQCVLDEFLKYEHCPSSAVEAFLALVNRFLLYNPYWKDTVPVKQEQRSRRRKGAFFRRPL